jgi:hypothetical protein
VVAVAPLGFAEPLSVALEAPTLVAGLVTTVGVAVVTNDRTVPYVTTPKELVANASK